METRGKDKLFLLGYDERQIIGAKLPTNGQVMRVLFYNLRKVNLSLRSSAALVIKEVEVYWSKARIPIRNVDKCVLKIESLYSEWKTLQKTCKRRSLLQEKREKDFSEKLDSLFDVAHANALSMMSNEEDKVFLLNQRKKGQPGSMIGCDKVLFDKEKRKNLRREEENRRCLKYKESLQNESVEAFVLTSDDDEEINEQPDKDITVESEDEAGPSKPKKIRAQQSFITTKLVAVLDTCKVSDRDSVRILISVVQALGYDVSDLIINRSSIRRSRLQLRAEKAQEIRNSFKEKEVGAITVHWDGKILPSLMGIDHVDRLPVVISFNGGEQLLGIPAIPAGTGNQQAMAVYNLLEEWGLVENVEALCCDTTASNLGRLRGACTTLEQKIGKDLLYLPCRHHIYEIILRCVFEEKIEASSGPGVPIFKRFRDTWSKINKNNFLTGIEDKLVSETLDNVNEIIEFASENLLLKQPRNDYKEFIQLAVVFLGGNVPKFTFRAPGAFHHARWMAKAIYSLKIFLFRNEFLLTKDEENGIRDICIFIIKVYLKPWIQAPVSAEAPSQDLNLLKNLYAYKEIDERLSQELLRKFCNHLWYLTPENSALAFFDPHISNEEKARMVKALERACITDVKKLTIPSNNISQYIDKNIDEFISQKSTSFFRRFSIPTDFLEIDPAEWKNNASFNIGLDKVSKLKVVNDSAERSVKLMEDYNSILSRNEEEKQLIMQIVSDFRKRYPDTSKETLSN